MTHLWSVAKQGIIKMKKSDHNHLFDKVPAKIKSNSNS